VELLDDDMYVMGSSVNEMLNGSAVELMVKLAGTPCPDDIFVVLVA